MKLKILSCGISLLVGYSGSTAWGQTVANCAPATSQFDFSVNKVRTTLQGSGDVFFKRNPTNSSVVHYEVPKGSGKSAIYVSAIWIAGFNGSNLKSAGQTYQSGRQDEYWPGPLTNTGSTTTQQCAQYDKHYFVTKAEIDSFKKTEHKQQALPIGLEIVPTINL